jgi:hypothetical protein
VSLFVHFGCTEQREVGLSTSLAWPPEKTNWLVVIIQVRTQARLWLGAKLATSSSPRCRPRSRTLFMLFSLA